MPQNDPREALAAGLEGLAQGPQNTQPPVPQAAQTGQRLAKPLMDIPPIIIEEAAKIIFEFWEREAQKANPSQSFVHWEDIGMRYQHAWREIVRLVLEMYASVLLADIHRFLQNSNGDMGEAFASALRRYAKTIMNYEIRQQDDY